MVSSVKCHYRSVMSGAMGIFPRAVGDLDEGHQLRLWKLPGKNCFYQWSQTHIPVSHIALVLAKASWNTISIFTAHVLVPHRHFCAAWEHCVVKAQKEGYLLAINHSCDKVTLDNILTSIKEEIPFTSSRMNLLLPFSTGRHTKPNRSKWRQGRGVLSLKYFMSEKPTTYHTVIQKPPSSLKQPLPSLLKIKMQGTKSYYSAHSQTSTPKDT